MYVLEVLKSYPQTWLEGEAIFRELIVRGTQVSLTSVYRAIKDLDCRGLLLREWRNGLAGGKAVYKLRSENPRDQQSTIVCRQCGMGVVADDSGVIESLHQLAVRQGLLPTKQPITIYITCDRCERTLGKRAPSGKNISAVFLNSRSLQHV